MDRGSVEQKWSTLSRAMDEIVLRNSSQLSFEELYRNSYNLVIQKHGRMLYDNVTQKISQHLNQMAQKLAATSDSLLLETIVDTFQDHVTTMQMIQDILMYMDRTFVTSNHERSTYTQGVHLYRVIVWEHPNVQSRASDLLLQAISKERLGLLTDNRDILKNILQMLLSVDNAEHSNIYERDFGDTFLGQTQEFYQLESSEYLATNSASDYVKKATFRLEEESSRGVALGLAPSTMDDLMNVLYTELIQRHASTLVTMEQSGFAVLLKDETKMDAMCDMYTLMAKVPASLESLRNALCHQVKEDGKMLVAEQERQASDPTAFVKGVLKMNQRYNDIVEKAFQGEVRAKKRLKESFEHFLNGDTRAASCLAIYADELLRSGIKGLTEAEIINLLNDIILVFRFISDKDVFETFYKQNLAKRLLAGRSVSDEAEKQLVSLLKAECGYQFTSKLEGMFNDMRISRDTRESYKTFKRDQANDGKVEKGAVDIDVDVLTTGYWPNAKVPICTLPESVQAGCQHFESFYLEKHTGRKLAWQTSTGTAEIKATYHGGKSYVFILSTYQMCILMQFNNGVSKLTLKEIAERTNIPDLELRRHLISLCTPKHRIIRKGSKGKGIIDNDTFTLNEKYESKNRRVKVPLVSMKEASKSKDRAAGGAGGSTAQVNVVVAADGKLPPQLEEERRHLVEAATVRIMKSRKKLKHNDLIAEVTKQLQVRFVPSPQFIKKRIEGLIEREYLERDENDHRVYLYVA